RGAIHPIPALVAPTRLSTLISAAIVLVAAWLAGRIHIEAGVAIAAVGVALACARGALAVPVAVVLAAATAAPLPVVGVLVVLGLVYTHGAVLIGWGGPPTSGRIN
ncbi:MAG TPA: hypothetical protein VF715_03930, partial [Thermoleophilaceae bacterium]